MLLVHGCVNGFTILNVPALGGQHQHLIGSEVEFIASRDFLKHTYAGLIEFSIETNQLQGVVGIIELRKQPFLFGVDKIDSRKAL